MFEKNNREQGVQVSKIEELVCRSVILCSQLAKCVNTKHLTFIESAVLCFCDFTYLTTCMLSYGGLCSLVNRHPLLTLAQAMPDPCAPSVLHAFNLWSHEVAVVSALYLEATYVNELLTKSLYLVLIKNNREQKVQVSKLRS